MSQQFEAGQLHKYFSEWSKLTNDKFILDIVDNCHLDIDVDCLGHLYNEDIQYVFNKEETVIMQQEIHKLLEIKAIKETYRQDTQIISPIFLRKNKTGDYRIVLNLEKLNEHVAYKHFKMENFQQAIQLVSQGDFMASIDLKKAYYSVRIAEEQQKYLCFRWLDKIYKFTCLPNGFSDGPRLFTKLMKPIFSTLRKKGHIITSFIDDTLMCSSTNNGCYDSINDTIQLLQRVGFCINIEKSVLIPTTSIEYLGNIIDTVKMTVTLPERRNIKILQECSNLVSKTIEKIRVVAKVVGILIAALPAVELGKLHYRKIERAKIKALEKENGNFDGRMDITDEMKTDLTWWIKELDKQDMPIVRKAPEVVISTDASDLGWAGCLNELTTNGRWSNDEKQLHINARELLAILFTLKSFSQLLRGRHIKVLSDNTTAINYVNEMGGVRSVTCDDICLGIWDWCITNNVWLTASHIPGKDNVSADTASRSFNDRYEWQLNKVLFQNLCEEFGTPCIDLFASRLNKQVEIFCSWMPDPEATFINAFTITWAQFKLVYIFPPFSLIPRCLKKLREERARGWIIVPHWPSQPWMSLILRLLVDHPRLIQKQRDVLIHPSSAEEHPIMRNNSLLACRLSGHNLEHKEYLRRVRKLSWPPGKQEHKNSTALTLKDGQCFVIEGTLIPFIPLLPIS